MWNNILLLFNTDNESHESLRIVSFRARDIVHVQVVTLYDPVTMKILIFVGFGWICTTISRIDYNLRESITSTSRSLETVTNQFRIRWMHIRIGYENNEFQTTLDNSYEFPRTCFGVYSWDSWQIRSRFVVKPWIHEFTNELIISTNGLRFSYDT